MSSLFKMFLATTFASFSVHAVEPAPAVPTCSRETESTDVNGVVTKYPHYSCIQQWNVYNTVQANYKVAIANGKQSNYAGLVEPTKPADKNCSSTSDGQTNLAYQACVMEEQRQLLAYNEQKVRYDLQKQQLDQAAALKADIDARNAASASAGYAAASEQNQKGSAVYQIASSAAGVAGGHFLMRAMGCTGTCNPQPDYVKAAVAFGIMGIALSQSGRMDQSGYAACQSGNATSSSQVSCGTAPIADIGNPYDPSNPNNILSQIGSDGKCLPTAPADCANKVSSAAGLAGLKISDVKGVNAFAGDKLKIAADGTVTFPNGKKTTLSDLMTQEGMVKAGLSAQDAAALIKQFGINSGTIAGLDAKKELKDANTEKPSSLDFGDSGGTSSIQNSANKLNGNANADKNAKRAPTSEGLTRSFNGESIGAAGDDIFSMMNRRYKLKTAQDTFIGQ